MDELKRLHADDDGVEAEATVADETRGVAARARFLAVLGFL